MTKIAAALVTGALRVVADVVPTFSGFRLRAAIEHKTGCSCLLCRAATVSTVVPEATPQASLLIRPLPAAVAAVAALREVVDAFDWTQLKTESDAVAFVGRALRNNNAEKLIRCAVVHLRNVRRGKAAQLRAIRDELRANGMRALCSELFPQAKRVVRACHFEKSYLVDQKLRVAEAAVDPASWTKLSHNTRRSPRKDSRGNRRRRALEH